MKEAGESEREELFFRFWTLKESYVKAVGCGITVPLQDIKSFPTVVPQYKAGYPRVTHPSATNLHIARLQCKSVRLACVRHAASVHPEPGSNSHVEKFFPASFIWHCLLLIRVASRSFDRSACS